MRGGLRGTVDIMRLRGLYIRSRHYALHYIFASQGIYFYEVDYHTRRNFKNDKRRGQSWHLLRDYYKRGLIRRGIGAFMPRFYYVDEIID